MMFISDVAGEATTAQVAGVCALIWFLSFAVWRLYLHPLSHFPGPRLAALTRWYDFYCDVVKDGSSLKRYPALHEKFGIVDLFW